MITRVLRSGVSCAVVAVLAVVPLAHLTTIHDQTEVPKRALAGLGLWLIAAAWWLAGRPDEDRGVESRAFRVPSAAVLLGLFCAWQILSAPFGYAPARAVGSVFSTVEALGWLLLSRQVFAGRLLRLGAATGLAIAAAIASLVGILQLARAAPEAWPGAVIQPLVTWWSASGSFGFTVDQTDVPGSLFGHANVAAEFVAMALPLTALGAASLALRSPRRWWLGPLLIPAVFLVALLGLFVVRTGSRGAILALVAAAGLTWFDLFLVGWRRRPLFGRKSLHLLIHVLAATSVLGGAVLLADVVKSSARHGQEATSAWDRLRSAADGENTTVRERRDLWANTGRMILDHPVFGAGPGGFPVLYPAYARAVRTHELGRYTLRRQPEKPHDEPLRIAAENGWPGALLWLLAIGAVLTAAGRNLIDAHDRGAAAHLAALGPCLSLLVVLVVALMSFPFLQTATSIGFWVLAGAVLAVEPRASRQPSWRVGSRGRCVGALVCILFFAVSLAHYRARLAASADLRDPGPAMVGSTSSARQRALERLRRLDQAATRVPGDYGIELLRGEFLRRLGRYDESEAAFLRTLDLHPWLINGHFGLGSLYHDAKRLDDARREADRAIALNPDAVQPRLLLARVLSAQGSDGAAATELRRALELRPLGPQRLEARLRLAAIASAANDAAAAHEHLARARRLAPDNPAVLETEARIVEREAPGSDLAFRTWLHLVEIDSEHAEANLMVGIRLLNGGRPAAALDHLDRAFRGDPFSRVALFHRGRALFELERLQEARDSLYECMQQCAKFGGDETMFQQCVALVRRVEDARRDDEVSLPR